MPLRLLRRTDSVAAEVALRRPARMAPADGGAERVGRGLRREGTHGGDAGRWQRSAGARARNADGHAWQAAPVGDGARLPGGAGGKDARPAARVAAATPAPRPQL